MSTYKIRTHNRSTLFLATFFFALLPLFVVALYPVSNDTSLYQYLLNTYKVAPETIHNFSYVFLLYLVVIGAFCYYLICTINNVTISEEGVHAIWYRKLYSFKKEERTIKWEDMESYHSTGGTSNGFITGFSITTVDKETFSFYCIYLFFKQPNFKAFIKDFEEYFEDASKKGLTAWKEGKKIYYNPDEPWR